MSYSRYIEKFESFDGALSYVFPLDEYEWQSSQPLRVPLREVVGASYGADMLGSYSAPKDFGKESVRLKVIGTRAAIETEIATARALCWRIGVGKLWSLFSDGTRHWSWARLTDMPDFTVAYNNGLVVPLSFEFVRQSDWYGETQITGSQKLDSNPENFTIANPGLIPTSFIVWRFRADSATAFANMTLQNLTNGFSFQILENFTIADAEFKVDGEQNTVQKSLNDGASYANDYEHFSFGTLQVAFMRLEPGNNSISVSQLTGTPDATLEWAFNASYE